MAKPDHCTTQSVQVAVRVRDLIPRERLKGCVNCVTADEGHREVVIGGRRAFALDHAFGTASTQEQIYKTLVAPLLRNSLQGYNMTVFAYGAPHAPRTAGSAGHARTCSQ